MAKNLSRAKGVAAVLCSLVLATCSLGALAGCSQFNINTNTEVTTSPDSLLSKNATLNEGVLTVGINGKNSPYGGTNPNGDMVGMDVDIAAALADEMGLTLQIVDVEASGKADLAEKHVDIALGVTKAGSGGTISYSKPYIDDGSALYRKTGAGDVSNITSEVNAGGKILVQSNTASGYEVQEALGVDVVRSFNTVQEAFDALEAGEGIALATDAVIGDYLARNYDDIERAGYLSSESVTPIYAVALTENGELTHAMKNAVKEISKNGVLRVIVDKWLGDSGESLMPKNVKLKKIPDMFLPEEDVQATGETAQAEQATTEGTTAANDAV